MVQLSRSFYYKFTVHITVLQPQFCRNKAGLGCSPFARHYLGNNYCFLFLRLLRCFSSAGWLLPYGRLYIFNVQGFPIRRSPDYRLFPPPRSLSQVVASFIVSESQGIHHTLLITFLLTYIVLFNLLYLLSICQRTFPLDCGLVENIGFEPMTPSLQS
jgi:hypothetical protein